jgi:hypothetical protein
MSAETRRAKGRFAFIQDDVRAQIAVSKNVLDAARRVDRLIKDAKSEVEKNELTRIRDELISEAGRLADNATATSNTAIQVLVSVSGA